MRPADLAEERLEEIDAWWEGGFLGTFAMASPHEERVRLAFRDVLLRLSEEEFDRFTGARPQLVCALDLHGSVFRYLVSAPPEEAGGYVTIIYLGPVVARLNDADLRALVAHEVADVVLGHSDHAHHGGHADEATAHAMATSWGFRRAALGSSAGPRSEEARPPSGEIHGRLKVEY
jgi:hypothetical protein